MEVISAAMSTTKLLSATTDIRYMGYYSGSAGWSMMGCTQSDEFYTESGTYFGCKTIYTDCTTAYATDSSLRGMQYGCASSDYSCVTQVMHQTWLDPPRNTGQNLKKKPVCVPKSWGVIDLYRTSPVAATPTPSFSSTRSSTLTPTTSPQPSGPTVAPTSTASQTSAPSPSPPVSPGITAGASIAGVALLLVLALLVWFFCFHRQKTAAQQQHPQEYAPQTWEQPELQQIYEVDAKGVPVSPEYGHGYAAVHQDPPVTWAHQNTYEVSELASEQQSRR